MPRHVPVKLKFQTARVLFALIMREMTTTYGRSPGGYLWAVLEPAIGIMFLTMVFAMITQKPPLGTSFPLFYATGLLPFTLYLEMNGKIAQAIRFSQPLLTYPRVTFLDAVIARYLLAMITNVLVIFIILYGIIIFFDAKPHFDIAPIAQSILLTSFLGFSIGSINSLLFAFFPVWERVWAILNRPLLLISSVFYLFEVLPDELQWWLWLNPLSHLVGLFRKGCFPEYHPEFISITYVLIVCMVLSGIGVFFLHFYHRKIMNEL